MTLIGAIILSINIHVGLNMHLCDDISSLFLSILAFLPQGQSAEKWAAIFTSAGYVKRQRFAKSHSISAKSVFSLFFRVSITVVHRMMQLTFCSIEKICLDTFYDLETLHEKGHSIDDSIIHRLFLSASSYHSSKSPHD